MKKYQKQILAFIIPCLIMLIIFLCCRYLVTDKSIATSDMQAQYVSLFNYYKDLWNGSSSLMYDFSKGLGGPMIATFAYYLASPLNVIFTFVSNYSIPIAIVFLILVKVGLSGLFMYMFLSHKEKTKNYSTLIFSSCYALSAFMINFHINIMWLDCVMLLPLIFLGIDKMFEGKRSILYIVSLTIAIISNYYIGFMVCIASGLYLIYKLITNYKNKNETIKMIIKWGVASVLSGLLTAVILIPTLAELSHSAKTISLNNLNGIGFFTDVNPLEFLSRFFLATHNASDIIVFRLPNLYCGLIVLPLVYFFFVNKKFKLKEKIALGSIIAFLSLSILIDPLNLIWHGLNYPASFVYRFSFILIFFLIFIAYKSFQKLKEVDLKHYLIFLIGFIVVAFLTILFKVEKTDPLMLIISVGIVGIYLLLLYLLNKMELLPRQKRLFQFCLIMLALGELLFNGVKSIYLYKTVSNQEYRDYIEIICPKITSDTDEFYRAESYVQYSNNDAFICGNSMVNSFISGLNSNLVTTFKNFGAGTGDHSTDLSNGNLLLDSLLGVKKRIYLHEEPDLKKLDSFDYSIGSASGYDFVKNTHYLYENENALPLGYLINDRIDKFLEEFLMFDTHNYYIYQNTALNTMADLNYEYYESIPVLVDEDYNFAVDLEADGTQYYMRLNATMPPRSMTRIYFNGEIGWHISPGRNSLVKIPERFYGGKVIISFETRSLIDDKLIEFDVEDINVAKFNYSEFEEAINVLKQNPAEIKEMTDTYIKFNVTVPDDNKLFFTSVPNDAGWKVYVDGKKTEPITLLESFIGLDLDEGEYIVEFKYETPYLKLGALISLITLVITIVYLIFEEKLLNFIMKLYEKYEEIIIYLIMGVLATVLNIGLYFVFSKIGINYIVNTIISWIITVLFAFFTNKIFVFKSKKNTFKQVLNEMIKFFQYRIVTLIMELAIMWIFFDMMGFSEMIIKIVAQVVVIASNYVFSKLFVFKKN